MTLTLHLRFYVLNRSSFGGFTEQNKNAFSSVTPTRTLSSHRVRSRNLFNISQIIQPWRITNQDYRDLMEGPGEDVFVFLDPPYLIKDMLYGKDKEIYQFLS